ncbi:MAG: phosphoribosyl-AMP cyclohydrolase [Lentisphaeraceae bacterium]|nr:phosphoribosyl-AMP cyclohydrolase [Lentisphaeraceae bacterium]
MDNEIPQPYFKKSATGLLPAIAQDWETSEVLMLAYINEQSWKETLKSGKATYWSRSRQELWKKGDTSGNVQLVKDILIDCDRDTVIFKVEQVGNAACHKGYRSCFFRSITEDSCEIVSDKVFNPEDVYKK